MSPTVTITTTWREEEDNGWSFEEADTSVGIYGGWGHDCEGNGEYMGIPEEISGGLCGDPIGSIAVLWERLKCQTCGAVLITVGCQWWDEEIGAML